MNKKPGLGPIPLSKGGQGVVVWIIILAVLIGGGYLFAKKAGYVRDNTPSDIIQPLVVDNSVSVPADWKTYRNEKYGFSINLPPSWKGYRVNESPTNFRGVSFGIKDQDVVVKIIVLTKKEYSDCEKGALCPVTFIAQNDADVFVLVHAQDYTDSIFTTPGIAGSDVWDSIISTFKFTNAVSAKNDFKNWKTYHNEENGFELKYPTDFKQLYELRRDGPRSSSIEFFSETAPYGRLLLIIRSFDSADFLYHPRSDEEGGSELVSLVDEMKLVQENGNILIDGNKGLVRKTVSTPGGTVGQEYWVFSENLKFELDYSEPRSVNGGSLGKESLNRLDQIISTFKFTK